jgi:hypothetical protein
VKGTECLSGEVSHRGQRAKVPVVSGKKGFKKEWRVRPQKKDQRKERKAFKTKESLKGEAGFVKKKSSS